MYEEFMKYRGDGYIQRFLDSIIETYSITKGTHVAIIYDERKDTAFNLINGHFYRNEIISELMQLGCVITLCNHYTDIDDLRKVVSIADAIIYCDSLLEINDTFHPKSNAALIQIYDNT